MSNGLFSVEKDWAVGAPREVQEPPDALNCLTEDDLPSEMPSSDVVLRELEEFLRQHQEDPGPNSGSDIRAMRSDVHRVPRSASERPGGHWL